MPQAIAPPETVDALRSAILERYDQLSGKLKQVARYVLDEPRAAALETLAEIGQRCDVQPSAVVRFAQAFGFEGAAPMQRLLKQDLVKNDPPLAYAERARRFSGHDSSKGGDPRQLLNEFVSGASLAVPTLQESVDESALLAAVRRISKAHTVYVAGFRRSFPVAAYLAYSLQQAQKKVVLIDGVGGLGKQQLQGVDNKDLLIAISFAPYAQEALAAVDAALDAGAGILTITDSLVSPLAKSATIALQVREAEVRGFRSLASSMCLAQVLAVSLLFERNGGTAGGRRAGG